MSTPSVSRDEIARLCDTDLAPALRALDADPRDAAAFEALLTGIAGRILPGARWASSSFTGGGAVQASGLFGPRAGRLESPAGLVGATRPPGLVFAEIRLYDVAEHHDANRPNAQRRYNVRRETDLFRGLFFAFDLGGTARGTTLVLPHRVGPAIVQNDALDAVAFDDPAFERVYRVVTSDAEEARALLQPSTRAGLVRLHQAAGHAVHLSLSDRRASVAVEYGAPRLVPGGPVDADRVAEIAGLFGLVDLAAAALPVGVALAVPAGAAPADAPGRPATSRTRVTRRADGLVVEYTDALSIGMLALGGLAAPLLAWGWLAALRALLAASATDIGPLMVLLPLVVATLLWLFAAQAWWAPLRQVELAAGTITIRRGLLRTKRVPVASVRTVEARKGVLHADEHALSPPLRGAELEWLEHELGRALAEARRTG